MRRGYFDVDMPDAQVLTVPAEQGLELMPIIGLDGVDTKRKLFSNAVHNINGIFLRVLIIMAP